MKHSKYDFDLDMDNPNSLSLIINQIKRGSTVLEFGPANGRMTKYLKEALDCKVYLVEIDEVAGKEALQYGEDLVIDDIETYSWYEKYEDIRFDYITFADVLEHLRNPKEVIIRAKHLLKKDGSIVLSVPNMAHNSVLISLLNNDFEYTEVGLLDNTHIHFFTKNSLENMMNEAGLIVTKRFATYAPVGSTEIPVHNDMVQGIDASFWKTRKYGEIYQFVYEAKKDSEYVENTETHLSECCWHYFARVFLDRGDGYKGEDVISKVLRDVSGNIVFETVIPQGVKEIRFVPFDDLCFVQLESFTDIVAGEEQPLRIVRSNAVMKDDNKYMFSNQAPYIDFAPASDRGFCHIRVIYKFITIDKNYLKNFDMVCKKYTEDLENLTMEYEVMHKENIRLGEVVEALTGQVAHLDNLIKAMRGTIVWKAAEPLRRLRNKFKKR